jgi:photosystem II stability/assembly factor-like uncharacterized protein
MVAETGPARFASALRRFLAILAIIMASCTPADEQASLHTESFDDPSLPGWELGPGAEIANSVLRVPAGTFGVWRVTAGDFRLSHRARLSGEGELVISYSVSDAGAYRLALHPEFIVLQREVGGAAREMASVPGDFAVGQWAQLVIGVSGGEHSVSLNGQLLLVAHDPEPLPPGWLQLQVRGAATGEFDDLVLEVGGEGARYADLPTNAQPGTGGPTPEQPAATLGAPAYQAGAWVRLGGPPGGLGYDIRMRPDNPDEMYVTDARAGIFKSVDGGLTWFATNSSTMVFGPEEVIPIFCATIDPHDYDVVWVGTQVSGHLYRSENGGQSWESRDEGIPHEGRSLRGITIDPNDASVVYVGLEVDAGTWQREHPEASAEVAGGEIYKSTDGGLTWTRIWQGPNVARYVWVDPRNSSRVYVSTGIFDRIPANSDFAAGDRGGVGILRSDDAGRTWTVLDERHGLGGRVIPSLFMHPADPDTLVAAVYGAGDRGGVYATRDGGDTWSPMMIYPLGIHNVEIATSDPDVWYAATEDAAFRSDDAGQTWQEFHLATPDRGAGMPIDMQVDPRDPYRVFVNNYGGSNFLSTDGGRTWVDASRGYTGASVGVFVMRDGSVLAEANTGIFRSVNEGWAWVGLTYTEETAPVGGPLDRDLFASGGDVLQSSDGGAVWSRVPVVSLRAEVEAGRIENDVLASRLAVAPSAREVVYLAFQEGLCATASEEACFRPMPGFFRSQDGGNTWEELEGGPFESTSTRRIAVHPEDSRTLLAATGLGLYLTSDGADSWQEVSALTEAAGQIAIWDTDSYLSQSGATIVTDVVFDPFDPNIVYAAVLQKGVFRSDDGGVTWSVAAYGMDPNEPVLALVADPNRPGVVYAGSKWSGVFISTDGAQSWRLIAEGLTSPPISLALYVDGSVLYAGTFNDGTWRLGGD